MVREHADALFVAGDPVFGLAAGKITEFAANHKLPAIYQTREFAAVGGLMSYGIDRNGLFRQVATYVDKLLKGAKPANLPVEQPTKFQLVVNLKAAQALGLTIPAAILAGADEGIRHANGRFGLIPAVRSPARERRLTAHNRRQRHKIETAAVLISADLRTVYKALDFDQPGPGPVPDAPSHCRRRLGRHKNCHNRIAYCAPDLSATRLTDALL